MGICVHARRMYVLKRVSSLESDDYPAWHSRNTRMGFCNAPLWQYTVAFC